MVMPLRAPRTHEKEWRLTRCPSALIGAVAAGLIPKVYQMSRSKLQGVAPSMIAPKRDVVSRPHEARDGLPNGRRDHCDEFPRVGDLTP
jgi:hypothetical protein